MTIAKRTAVRLSDGRELIYFDETPDAERDFPTPLFCRPPEGVALK